MKYSTKSNDSLAARIFSCLNSIINTNGVSEESIEIEAPEGKEAHEKFVLPNGCIYLDWPKTQVEYMQYLRPNTLEILSKEVEHKHSLSLNTPENISQTHKFRNSYEMLVLIYADDRLIYPKNLIDKFNEQHSALQVYSIDKFENICADITMRVLPSNEKRIRPIISHKDILSFKSSYIDFISSRLKNKEKIESMVSIESITDNLEKRIKQAYMFIERKWGDKISKPKNLKVDYVFSTGFPILEIEGKTSIKHIAHLTDFYLTNWIKYFELHRDTYNLIIVYSDCQYTTNFLDSISNQYSSNTKLIILSINEFERLCFERAMQRAKAKIKKEEKQSRLISLAGCDFQRGNFTLFLGAGVGASVYMPSWVKLLTQLVEKANDPIIKSNDYNGIEESCGHSPLIIGRYIEELYKDHDFTQAMSDSLYNVNVKRNLGMGLLKEIVEMVKTGNVMQIITYNYDDLVETALDSDGFKGYHSVYDASFHNGPKMPIYHVHGMIPQTRKIGSTPVLGEREYHNLYKESFHWSNVVQLQALRSSTCLFIGLSMTDPNLRRLLDISQMYGKGLPMTDNKLPPHYAIMPESVFSQPLDNDKIKRNTKIQEDMLKSLGVNVIWYENKQYGDIPRILEKIMAPQ